MCTHRTPRVPERQSSHALACETCSPEGYSRRVTRTQRDPLLIKRAHRISWISRILDLTFETAQFRNSLSLSSAKYIDALCFPSRHGRRTNHDSTSADRRVLPLKTCLHAIKAEGSTWRPRLRVRFSCRCCHGRPKEAPSIAGVLRTAGRRACCPNPARRADDRVRCRGTRWPYPVIRTLHQAGRLPHTVWRGRMPSSATGRSPVAGSSAGPPR